MTQHVDIADDMRRSTSDHTFFTWFMIEVSTAHKERTGKYLAKELPHGGLDTKFDVDLKINGEQVDFVSFVASYEAAWERVIKNAATKLVKERLGEASTAFFHLEEAMTSLNAILKNREEEALKLPWLRGDRVDRSDE